jgi:hypothetical protein
MLQREELSCTVGIVGLSRPTVGFQGVKPRAEFGYDHSFVKLTEHSKSLEFSLLLHKCIFDQISGCCGFAKTEPR